MIRLEHESIAKRSLEPGEGYASTDRAQHRLSLERPDESLEGLPKAVVAEILEPGALAGSLDQRRRVEPLAFEAR